MIAYFARHPTAANLLMLTFLVSGLLTLSKLRRETFPDFSPQEVEVRVLYPGATAEEVEEVICQRIEDAIDGVRFVDELRSEAREGVAVVVAKMEESGDFISFKDEIDTQIAAIDDFPQDVEDPVITELHTTTPVISILVAGPMSAPDLKAYCEGLKDHLQALDDVSLVDITGFSDHQFRVSLSASALMRHNLSAAAVADVIGRQSINLPAGTIETRDRDILIRFLDQSTTVSELEDIVVISSLGGAELRVRDLGYVTDCFEKEEDKVMLGEQRAGLMVVKKTKNQDTIRVARQVKDFLAQERARHPQLTFVPTQDSSTLVLDRLNMLVTNGVQGMVLVFLVMWMFFNLRLSFWVVMSLPVSFLGAFFVMPYVGLTINMLTMVGLLLGLGLLMDDGIVIAENVATHRQRGKPAMQAAIDGVREVGGGVVSSFLTTVCVLGPLAAISGDIGKVLKVVPMILILVLTVSLVEAFMILPGHLGHSLSHERRGDPNRVRRALDAALAFLREQVLGRLVDTLLRWRYLWISCVVMVFLIAISLVAGGVLRFQAFPDLDGNVIVARVLMPPGTPLPKTEQVVNRVTTALAEVNRDFAPRQPKGKQLVETVYVQFSVNADAFETGPHVATVFVDLLQAEERDARVHDILRAWREKAGHIPDAISITYAEPTQGPSGRAIEIRMKGSNLADLSSAAREVKDYLGDFRGVYNLTADLREGKPEFRLKLRDGVLGMGLNGADLARQLRADFHGVTADEIQVGSESYDIDVQLAATDQNSLADLDYLQVTLPDGRQVPLTAVAAITRSRGWSRIARVDGQRAVTLRGDLDPTQSNTIKLLDKLQADLLPGLYARYPGVTVAFEGEIKEGGKTQASMMQGMLTGLIGVFILLSFQFRSYIEPIIVMVAIPLSLIGVVFGHLLLGYDMSMPSTFGFVSLAGIVVNDSILLVLFLKQRRAEGNSASESAALAGRERFRAILITSATTVAGLTPLLFERSLQAQVLIPLVISIVFGLLSSTVLVLLVIPCLYMILHDCGLSARVEGAEA